MIKYTNYFVFSLQYKDLFFACAAATAFFTNNGQAKVSSAAAISTGHDAKLYNSHRSLQWSSLYF